MASTAVCTRFSQNAWKREMCSNCFKTRTEHPAPPTRPISLPPSFNAKPKQSILKGSGNTKDRKTRGSVCFPPSEAEVIGYDGGDVSGDDEDDVDSAPISNDHGDETLFPGPSEEEEKALQNLTRRNTDFNSENSNLLTDAPKIIEIKPEPIRIELGRKATAAPVVSVTPFGVKSEPVKSQPEPPKEQERVPHTERRPPLGHEDTSAPLTAPALVKLQVKEVPVVKTIEPAESQVEPVILLCHKESVEVTQQSPAIVDDSTQEKPQPAFLRHKDSVDLISPPASPILISKTEERPVPIGKVSSTLTVTLKNAPEKQNNKESNNKRGAKIVEARSSALIRRWTVGERVLLQPRRPVLDAPEIVPLTLQSSNKQPSIGLEPRELAGQPDGEDSVMTAEPNAPPNITTVETEFVKPRNEEDKIIPVNRVEDIIEIQVRDKADQPPTPPSSPLPDEDTVVQEKKDAPPSLPASPPPSLQSKPAPSRPTSLPAPVTPRSSFLHGAMLGRPQVPAKPAALLASITSAIKRHSASPSPTIIAVSTPQLPTSEPPRTEESNKPESVAPREEPPVNNKPPVTPELETSSVYDTPRLIKNETPLLISNETPKYIINTSPKITPNIERQNSNKLPPKSGSYKKRQAPKPPVPEKTHVRNPSQDSFEELGRLEKTSNKKNNSRFSLRRLLRLNNKEDRATSPESPNSTASSPSPPSSPSRPEIIHPSTLDGREVQVVSRIQQSGGQNVNNATTPPGRPRPPPPPPRTMSLSPETARPSRPPPPQSIQLLQQIKSPDESSTDPNDDDHAVYANLDSLKQKRTPSKPQRNGSIRDTSPESGRQLSPCSDDGDYETVEFLDGRMSRRRRSTTNTLEENYGAVVGANHRALAQLVSSLCAVALPAMSSTNLSDYVVNTQLTEETKTLVLLQTLALLQEMLDVGTNSTSLTEFQVQVPMDSQKSAIGPRVTHSPNNDAPHESVKEVGSKICQLVLPSDLKLPVILASSGVNKASAYLEFKIWGPELAQTEKEVALQRWLDLERATALQGLAKARDKLPISQEMYVNFLVQASAVALAQASLL